MDFLATVGHATAVALRNARLLESVRGESLREKSARLVAERKAAELERYQSFFAHVSEGIAILDGKGRVLLLNPAGASMLDVDAAHLEGRHVEDLTGALGAEALTTLLCAVARGEVQRDVDVKARTPTRRALTLSVNGAPLHEGEAAAILSFRDVTEPRRIEDELRRTKEFLEKLIDNTVDAVVALDMKGRFILFNKGAGVAHRLQRAGGAREPSPPPASSSERTSPPSCWSGCARRSTAGPGRLALTRQEIVIQSGERVPVNMTGSILYEGKREVATVGILSDLRDRVQLERKLSDATLRLERSERSAEMIALAGTAAHELNQPLTSVLGYAELLKRKLAPGRLRLGQGGHHPQGSRADEGDRPEDRPDHPLRDQGLRRARPRILDLERASGRGQPPSDLQGTERSSGRNPLRQARLSQVVPRSRNMESLRVLPYLGFLTGR